MMAISGRAGGDPVKPIGYGGPVRPPPVETGSAHARRKETQGNRRGPHGLTAEAGESFCGSGDRRRRHGNRGDRSGAGHTGIRGHCQCERRRLELRYRIADAEYQRQRVIIRFRDAYTHTVRLVIHAGPWLPVADRLEFDAYNEPVAHGHAHPVRE
jgi:hypothetical protein